MQVYGGVGHEIYMQWVVKGGEAGYRLSVIRTVAITELNNDHGQFSVSSATCKGAATSAQALLRAEYEHDERPRKHRIRLQISDDGKYKLSGLPR
jgi:hypothetical protein